MVLPALQPDDFERLAKLPKTTRSAAATRLMTSPQVERIAKAASVDRITSHPPVEWQGEPDGSAYRNKVTGIALGSVLVFGWIGWLGFGICSLMLIGYVTSFAEYFNTTGGVSERFHSGAKFGSDKIAIIDIAGVIMEGDGFVKQQIDLIREDERVKAVVVRVESPGGTVTGSDYIFHHLRKLKKERNLKLVVSMGSIAASGGYYVSMAVGDEERAIFAEPTSTTGSIGVMIPHFNIAQFMTDWGIEQDSVLSHPLKGMGSVTRKKVVQNDTFSEAETASNSASSAFSAVTAVRWPVV